jgi:hypothetical protein
MTTFFAEYPATASSGGVAIYANFAAFPAASSVSSGTLAIALDTGYLYESNGVAWRLIGAGGSVTSVDMTVPSFLSVTGNPVTGAGTLAVGLSGTALPVASGGTGQTSGPWSQLTKAQTIEYFGGGTDGDATISGALTLTRDMFYHNLTISAGAAILPNGYRIFVSGTLDLTAAPAGAFTRNGSSGTNGTASGNGGPGGAGSASTSALADLGNGGNGAPGGQGGITTGNAGGSSSSNTTSNSGWTLNGGTGGNGAGGSGAVGGNGASGANPLISRWDANLIRGVSIIIGGLGGPGAGGGGGSGAVSGGGGGGGGGAGAVIFISANIVNRGASTAASVIQVNAGNGGAGGDGGTPTTAGCGGGGGGCGGGAGWIYFAYGSLIGSVANNLFEASGGAGGNGGNAGTGAGGGVGGASGGAGRLTLLDLTNGTVSENVGPAAVAGGAASGVTGGTGASANTWKVNL